MIGITNPFIVRVVSILYFDCHYDRYSALCLYSELSMTDAQEEA
jgi:hypothetical protein